MRIGVISDTHLSNAEIIPGILLKYFKNTDHIIHAGDIKSIDVIKQLEKLAPVTAVAGNIDPPDLHRQYGEKRILRLGKFNFGITHGDGDKGKTIERVKNCFVNDPVECIIFGHSHNPYCKYYGDRLLFNPGSPTVKRRNSFYSFGIIEIDEFINPSIIFFDSNGDIVERI